MRANSVRLLALLGVLGVAACSEDDGLVAGDLSEAEAQALANVIMTQAFASTASFDTAPTPTAGGPALTPFSFTRSVETTVSCPMGGDVDVEAQLDISGDNQTQVGEIDYSVTQVHNGCVVQAENGTQFTLNGNPDLQLDISVMTEGESSDWVGSISGNIAWEADGREGNCPIGLEFSGVVGQETVAFEMAGAVCGASVEQELSIG